MKKVLTLVSALSMVAGSAFAADHVWNMESLSKGGLFSIDKTTKKPILTVRDLTASSDLKVEKGLLVGSAKVDLDAKKNAVSFTASAGDVIYVTVESVNPNSEGGSVYFKDASNPGGKADVVAGTSFWKHEVTVAGEVVLGTDAGLGIKIIKVVSKNGVDAMTEYEAAKVKVNDANKAVAEYVTKYSDLFGAVKKDINAQSALVEGIYNDIVAKLTPKDELKGDCEGVSDADLAKWKADLSGYTTEIASCVSKAQAAVATYNTLDYATTRTKIADMAKDANKGKADCIYDAKKEGNKTKAVIRRDWLKPDQAEWKNIVDSVSRIETKALKALADNYKSYDNGTIQTEVDGVPTLAQNLINRANKENAIEAAVNALSKNIKALNEEVVKAEVKEIFKSQETAVTNLVKAFNTFKGEFDGTGEGVKRYMFDATVSAAWDNQLSDTGTGCQKNYDVLVSSLNTLAGTALKAKVDVAQKQCDETAYAISATYEGQPDAQTKYQAIFAGYQNEITAVNKKISSSGSTDFLKLKENLEKLDKTISNIDSERKNAMTGKNQELYDNNQIAMFGADKDGKPYGELTLEPVTPGLANSIAHAKAVYTEGIKKIESYRSIEGIEKNQVAANSITDAEVQLFTSYKAIQKVESESNAEYNKCQNSVKDLSVSEFKTADYKTALTAAETDITTKLNTAMVTVHDIAVDYETADDKPNTYTSAKVNTIIWAEKLVKKSKLDAGITTGFGTADKADADLTQGQKKAKADLNKITAEEIAKANKMIANSVATKSAADSIALIKETLSPVQKKVGDIVAELKRYNDIDGLFYNLKAEWTKASASHADDPELTKINTEIAKSHGELDDISKKRNLTAEDYDAFDKVVKEFSYRIFAVANPEAHKANEAANATITLEVNNALTAADAAIAEINKMDPSAQGYVTNVEDVKTALGQISTDATKSYNDRVLGDKLEDFKAKITAEQTKIENILKLAQEADEAAKKVPGDYNDDKKVNSVDAAIVIGSLGDTMNVTDYSNFLNNYQKFVDSNK